MSDEVTDLKRNLTNELRTLQKDNADSETRKTAYNNIIQMSNQLKKLDDNFEFDSKILEKYSAFRPDEVPQDFKRVNWGDGRANESLKRQYSDYVATAVSIVRERNSGLDSDSDKFGTIVNATVSNIIQIDLINQLDEMSVLFTK